MKRIPTPEFSYSSTNVTLSGESYVFTYRFNERSQRWKLDIQTADLVYVVKGLTLIEEFSPTLHLNLENFTAGGLIVAKILGTTDKCSFDNLGLGKNYELLYYDFNEQE